MPKANFGSFESQYFSHSHLLHNIKHQKKNKIKNKKVTIGDAKIILCIGTRELHIKNV